MQDIYLKAVACREDYALRRAVLCLYKLVSLGEVFAFDSKLLTHLDWGCVMVYTYNV